MKITDKTLFTEYQKNICPALHINLEKFDWSSDSTLEYLTQTSAVYSSNIEGNMLDVNSFMNRELYQKKSDISRDVAEITHLIEAYEFAQNNPLTEANMLHCHYLASRTLLIESKQGKYREEKVGVFGSSGLVYLAVEHEKVGKLMKELFDEIYELYGSETSPLAPPLPGEGKGMGVLGGGGEIQTEALFYHASLLHLVFAHIHPFADGNGRMARLLEKWLLATLGGEKFWRIPAEQYYKDHRPEYYQNINLGVNFYELDYSRAFPFLGMLAKSIAE